MGVTGRTALKSVITVMVLFALLIFAINIAHLSGKPPNDPKGRSAKYPPRNRGSTAAADSAAKGAEGLGNQGAQDGACDASSAKQPVVVEKVVEKVVYVPRDAADEKKASTKQGSGKKDDQQQLATLRDGGATECERDVRATYEEYFAFSQEAMKLRKKHGPLKIAGFSRLWPPPLHGKGGMQYHAMHLYSQLAHMGHEVHVFVTGGPAAHRILFYAVDKETLHVKEVPPNEAQLVIYSVPSEKNGEYSVAWYENVLHRYKEINATVGGFHVGHSESWAAVPNIYQLGLQVVVTWHGSMLDWFRNELNLIVHNFRVNGKMTSGSNAERTKALGATVAYEAYALLTVPHHIVISDSAYEDLHEINLVEKDRIHLIYNGVNAANFRPNPEARKTFFGKHKVDAGDFVVGCGGRLDGIKGHAQLSKAMRKVLGYYKNVTLVVAGSGSEKHRYESLQHAGLKVVLAGMLNQVELAQFYAAIDVFVDPFYQHHGLNTVMLEAVLSGTPIIATKLASAKTTVPCDDFGYTFPLGDIDGLADAVVRMMKNSDQRRRMASNVRQRALKLFTSAIMANRYEAVLYDAWLEPKPLVPVLGEVICRRTYPAMCYRTPHHQEHHHQDQQQHP